MDDRETKEAPATGAGQKIREHARLSGRYLAAFLRWVAVGLALGLAGGSVGAFFSLTIRWATLFRTAHSWIIWLLPLGGALIAALYRIRGARPTDTNGVLLAIHTPSAVPVSTAPLIFASTAVTHLLGGSAGREGAALQIGGALGDKLARLLHTPERETHIVVMCGMSAVFAALFGSPLTAAFFAMEVASVGIFHYSAIVPCLASALTASRVAALLGAEADAFPIPGALPFTVPNIALVIVIAAICALVSILYCVSLRAGERWMDRLLPNAWLRIMAGGLAIALLTAALGTTEYNGAGMPVIDAAMHGAARPEAFLLKLVFTVITVSSGYKGGEIVPCMFIGSTLGCTLARLLGLDPALGAAVGLLSLFCGSLNCPLSSMLLGAELFGGANIYFFAIACAVSYILSANYGLYKEQRLLYSKLRPEYLNRYTK